MRVWLCFTHQSSAASLATDLINVCGNTLVASGAVAYLGVFTAPFRAAALSEWTRLLTARAISIPCADPFELDKVCACVCVCVCVSAPAWCFNLNMWGRREKRRHVTHGFFAFFIMWVFFFVR